jgi:hypothetical protein
LWCAVIAGMTVTLSIKQHLGETQLSDIDRNLGA